MRFVLILTLLLLISEPIQSISCQVAGRGGCFLSCQAQNCATGYCTQGDKGVCVCTRCNTGPNPIWGK
jgi:hypothetical protein